MVEKLGNLFKSMFHFCLTCGILFLLGCSFLPTWEVLFADTGSQKEKFHALPYTIGASVKSTVVYIKKELI